MKSIVRFLVVIVAFAAGISGGNAASTRFSVGPSGVLLDSEVFALLDTRMGSYGSHFDIDFNLTDNILLGGGFFFTRTKNNRYHVQTIAGVGTIEYDFKSKDREWWPMLELGFGAYNLEAFNTGDTDFGLRVGTGIYYAFDDEFGAKMDVRYHYLIPLNVSLKYIEFAPGVFVNF